MAAIAVVFAIRKAPNLSARHSEPIHIRVRPLLRGPLGQLLLAMSVLELGNAAATFLILRATQVLTPAAGLETATQIALSLYVAYNVFATLASVPAGYIGDHKSPVLVVALGALLFAGAYLACVGATRSLLALGFALAGIGVGCLETGQHAAVAALAPEALRGSAFGLLAAVQSFGGFAASAIAGVLWTAVSPELAFLYLAVCMGLGGAGVLTMLGSQALGGSHSDLRAPRAEDESDCERAGSAKIGCLRPRTRPR